MMRSQAELPMRKTAAPERMRPPPLRVTAFQPGLIVLNASEVDLQSMALPI